MQIFLDDIRHLFPDSPAILAELPHNYSLTGWLRLLEAPQPYGSWQLYLCRQAQLDQIAFVENMHLLCLVDEGRLTDDIKQSVPPFVHVLFLECSDDRVVSDKLVRYFEKRHGIGLFSAGIMKILASEGSIQSMIDYAYTALGNPICYFDAGFNLMAANWEEAEKHSLGLEIIKNKGFTEREFEIANSRNHIHRRVQKSETPILAHNPVLGVDQLLCAIDTQVDLGHLVVTAVNQPFDEFHSLLLHMLKRCIYQKLKRDEFVRNSRGYNYEAFLRDLMDEKIATGKAFLTRMNYACRDFVGTLYCLVVEIARSAATINVYHIQSILETNLPNLRTLIYNGQIVGIWIRPEGQFLQREQLENVDRLCRENDLFAGMSNAFHDLVELSGYYKQALRAIELGVCTRDDPGLFYYENYYAEHLKNIFTQKESAEAFCHPKMKLLLDYDKRNGTELARTLYLYLVNERSVTVTAAALFMHRNSVTHRIEKIQSLIGEDFDDCEERQYLILSYRLMSSDSH